MASARVTSISPRTVSTRPFDPGLTTRVSPSQRTIGTVLTSSHVQRRCSTSAESDASAPRSGPCAPGTSHGSRSFTVPRHVGSRTGPLCGGTPTGAQVSAAVARRMNPSASIRTAGSRRHATTPIAMAAMASANAHSARSIRVVADFMPHQHRLAMPMP